MNLIRENVLVDNLLLIEGFTRAGKFLLANLLYGIEDIESYQYSGLLEHLPYLESLNLIPRETAKNIIKCQIDNLCYDRMIGRNLNFRYDDKSSVYNSPHLKKYLQRCLDSDGDIVVNEIKSKQPFFPFIVHETLPNISIYFEIYPNLYLLRVERHPIDLVFSWLKRGWGKRWGKDLKDFSMSIPGPNGPLPWFAAGWEEEYEQLSETDRVIRSISHLDKLNQESYSSLTTEQKSKIYETTYELLITNTDEEIQKIAKFLNKNILPEFTSIMNKEHCPNNNLNTNRSDKLSEIKQLCSETNFSLLGGLSSRYEEKWRLTSLRGI